MASLLSLTGLYEAPAAPGIATDEGKVRFLTLAARALAAVDEIPARIEESITDLAGVLDVEADCNATATAIFMTVRTRSRQWTEMVRVRAGGPDYTRAVALHRILSRVMEQEITPDDAAGRLEQLLAWRPRKTLGATMLASAVLSVSAGLLLRGQRNELLVGAALGAVVGAVLYWFGDREHLAPLLPVVLATAFSWFAFSAGDFGLDTIRPVPLLVASLVVFLPGWRMTVAMTELAQGHWTSGSGRFLAAITTLLLLIVGVAVGLQLSGITGRLNMALTTGIVPTWVRVLSPVAAGLAMTVLFSARRKDAVWITLICVVTSVAAFFGGRWLGSTASAFIGAFTAMAAATVLARRLKIPYLVLQQPATVLLVPGSIGFLSMGSLVTRNVDAAIETGFQMLFIALTLAIGAMAAKVAMRPLALTLRRRG